MLFYYSRQGQFCLLKVSAFEIYHLGDASFLFRKVCTWGGKHQSLLAGDISVGVNFY